MGSLESRLLLVADGVCRLGKIYGQIYSMQSAEWPPKTVSREVTSSGADSLSKSRPLSIAVTLSTQPAKIQRVGALTGATVLMGFFAVCFAVACAVCMSLATNFEVTSTAFAYAGNLFAELAFLAWVLLEIMAWVDKTPAVREYLTGVYLNYVQE